MPTLAAGAAAGSPLLKDPSEGGHLDLSSAAVSRAGTNLRFQAAGVASVENALRANGAYVCARVAPVGGQTSAQLCVRGPGPSVVAYRFDSNGEVSSRKRLGQVPRFDAHGTLNLVVPTSSVGLKHGQYAWRVLASTDPRACPPVPAGELPCADNVPNRGAGTLGDAQPELVGCEMRPRNTWRSASGSRREVALTFDDGPSRYTGRVISVLERMHAKGTFFMVGNQITGLEPLLKRELSLGYELANHSFDHSDLGGGGAGARTQLSSTSGAISAATGFNPCLFRPPYGSTSGALAGDAEGLGMNTILWDVDPRDWSTPGAGAIYSRIVGAAHAGSIILMHDGGGVREQTLAALPRVISTLRSRGYKFRTVSELIGNEPVYR